MYRSCEPKIGFDYYYLEDGKGTRMKDGWVGENCMILYDIVYRYKRAAGICAV